MAKHYTRILLLAFAASAAWGQAAVNLVPIAPCRVVDTRNISAPYITGLTTRNFTITSSCGIPSTAQAFSLNVAVAPRASLGFLTVWPAGQSQPTVSTLNSPDSRIKSVAAIIPAGNGGAVSVYASGDTDVIVDVDGYFVAATTSGSLAFYPVTPCRLVDTRINQGTTGGALTGGTSRTFALLSDGCGLPSGALAYSLNFTAVPTGPGGFYLTAYPTGTSLPLAATLNDNTATVVANAAISQAGSGGSIDVYASGNTNLVIDVNGYFAAPGAGGLSLYSGTPCRVLDTRQGVGLFSGELDVNVTASGCIGSIGQKAYVFNATAIPSGPLGYLELWPQGATQPLVSTLNAIDGAIANNMAIVPTNNTEVSAFASNPANLILDLFGYFAQPQTVPSTVQLTDLTQSGPYYFVGDSFTLTVTGTPGQPVTVVQNGVSSGVFGYTNVNGVFSLSASWASSDAGGYAQIWTVGGIPAAALEFTVIDTSSTGPPSISSYTAPSPSVLCTDITGNWIATPDSGPQSEWDLTQSGLNVTGTAYASWSAQCLTATYSVSGTYVNPVFVLNATNPSITVDNCGHAFPASDNHSVSLSGSSCSIGSGTWSTSPGTHGMLAQQSKTTPGVVTSNPTTAHYKIDYASYIPVDHIQGPTSCYTVDQFGNPIPHLVIYKGDAYHGSALFGSGYRTQQSLIAIPGVAHSEYPFQNTGATRNYSDGSPANGSTANLDSTPATSDIYNGPYTGKDEDNVAFDCKLWNKSGQAGMTDMQTPTASFPYATQAQVLFVGDASNPLEGTVDPPIRWNNRVVVDESNPTAPTAYVNYNHTCYPGHVVFVNGMKIYEYLPTDNSIVHVALCLEQIIPKVTGVSSAMQVPVQ